MFCNYRCRRRKDYPGQNSGGRTSTDCGGGREIVEGLACGFFEARICGRTCDGAFAERRAHLSVHGGSASYDGTRSMRGESVTTRRRHTVGPNVKIDRVRRFLGEPSISDCIGTPGPSWNVACVVCEKFVGRPVAVVVGPRDVCPW